MTIIAVTHGLVLSDKRRGLPSNLEDMLRSANMTDLDRGKVKTYDKPAKIHSRTYKFTDYFYGYAASGPEEITNHAGKNLSYLGSYDVWLANYMRMDEMRFLNDMTQFTILFFGLEGTLEVEVHSGAIKTTYHLHSETAYLLAGSGTNAFKKLRETYGTHVCPVKMVYGLFAMEPTCGGGLEVWTLPTSRQGQGGKMYRLSDANNLTIKDSFLMMADPYKQLHAQETASWLANLIRRSQKSSNAPSADAQLTHLQLAQVLLGKNWKRISPELKSLICT